MLLALLAAGLTIAFYAFLLAVVLMLLAAVVVLVRLGPGWGTAGALPIGLLVAVMRRSLVAAIPRRAQPDLRGIEVAHAEQPRLWELVDSLAAAAGQHPPDHLRITLGGSASATELRSGVGRTPQRILTLPFSYLIALSRAELGAVIAHELGHFAAGDTTASAWISPLSGAIIRTVNQLGRYRSVLRYPFRWYARGFFALTAGFSRRRELAADALAARLCGAEAVAGALRHTHGLAAAFDAFWAFDVKPPLSIGLWPPLQEGFVLFLEAPAVHKQLADTADDQGTLRFASHPTTERRVVAVNPLSEEATADDSSPASEMLLYANKLEVSLLHDLAGTDVQLALVDWREAGERATPRTWRDAISAHPWPNQQVPVSGLAQALSAALEDLSDEQAIQTELYVWGCALALALADNGWSITKLPGRPAALTKDEFTIIPRDEVHGLATSEITSELWSRRTQTFGIAELLLAAPEIEAQPDTFAAAQQATAGAKAIKVLTPGAPVVLRLSTPDVDGFAARGMFWFALLLGAACAAALLLVPLASTTATGAQVAVRSIGVVIGCLPIWLTWRRHRQRAHPPTLTIDADTVTLAHRGLLRAPLQIPRAAVRVIAVDDGEVGRDPTRRFPVYADAAFDRHDARGAIPRGWVWPIARKQWPRYSLERETPNTLILLNRQLPGPPVRREKLHGPLNGETISGLFACVADCQSAARALRAAGLARSLTVADVTEPPEQDAHEERVAVTA